jgi:hypothetical protein
MKRTRHIVLAAFLLCALQAPGQSGTATADSLASAQPSALIDSLVMKVDSLWTLQDSLNLFEMIDSLIELEKATDDQLVIRLAYNSNVLSAGRTLGISQFGLAPGISFYHRTGLYADVSAFWSNDYEPNYYLTTLSGGYLNTWGSYTLMASYDHYFYHDAEDVYSPFTNTAGLSNFFDFKWVSFRLDYSLFFGQEAVNRILPGITFSAQKRQLWGIDRIRIYPSAWLLLGDGIVTEQYFYQGLDFLRRLRRGLPLSYTVSSREFGLMNTAFSFPLTVSEKNWTFTVSYIYNIPKALPGETLTYSETGFLSASITYFIGL